jgi:integrase
MRKLTGTIDKPRDRWRVRFTAPGHGRQLFMLAPGASRDDAERERRRILSEVERGVWQPPAPAPVIEVTTDPLFHAFSSEWFAEREGEWRPNTRAAVRWELVYLLLPFFARHTLKQITVAEVDRYRGAQVAEAERIRAAAAEGKPIKDRVTDRRGNTYERKRKALSATSINKSIARLGQILEVAVEREYIERNPVKVNPRARKLKATKRRAVHLDNAAHITALLDAARVLDERAKCNGQQPRCELLSTLAYTGARVGEVVALNWGDLDLANGTLRFYESKDVHVGASAGAGVRMVDLVPTLLDTLKEYKARHPKAKATAPLFPSSAGTRQDRNRIRSRIMRPAIAEANKLLAERKQPPLPDGLTVHSLRHTYVSVLVALGKDLGYIMDQAGHDDESTTLRIYRHAIPEEQREHLRALVEGANWYRIGTEAVSDTGPEAITPARPGRFERPTSRSGGERSIH